MWVIITKNKLGDSFYPINIIGKKLKALTLEYDVATTKPDSFWKDKDVVFHCVWANNLPKVWRPLHTKVARLAKTFITEFDADKHLNNIETLDKASWGDPLLIYNQFAKVSPNFIWELPMSYNPFILDTKRIELSMYSEDFVEPKKDKDIDFLGFIDTMNRNLGITMRLLDVLNKQGHKVACIFLSKKYMDLYKNLGFETIFNTKFTNSGQKKFHDLLDRSKFYVDLANRLTAGRNTYEALFRHAVPVVSTTYGASKIGLPVDTANLDLQRVYQGCIMAHEKYDGVLEEMHNVANIRYNLERTIDELRTHATT